MNNRLDRLATALGIGACVAALGMAFTIALPQTAHAQSVTPPPVVAEAQGSAVVVDPEASGPRVSFMNLEVNLDPFTLRLAKGASPAPRLAVRSDRFLQATTSIRSGARARSTTRIVAGAIVGGVGGFFAGGFLGAHIEGDRCNCDDPGVRGFLIGAPIGAVAGGIVGAKLLF